MEKVERSLRLLDIIKFEIRCVRENILMSVDEKNAKIIELKLIVPGCKNWEGLDEILTHKKR